MAKEFFDSIGLVFIESKIEAWLHVVFYLCLYFLMHAALKFFKHLFISKISEQEKNVTFKTDISKAAYKIVRRILQLTTLYYVLISIPILDKFGSLISSAFYIFGVIITGYALFKSVDAVLYFSFNGRTQEFAPLLSRAIKSLIFILALMIGMKHFNYDIWHIATALGIGSLAVGLAAQPTLTNLISGFNILIDRPFQIGDRIKLASGEIGDVVRVGLRSTEIRTTDGNMLISPNTDLGNSKLINYSKPDSGTSHSIKLHFDQNSDYIKIKSILSGSLEQLSGMTEPAKVLLNNVNDGVIEVSINIKIQDFALQSEITDRLLDEALTALRKNQLPLASRPFKFQV